MAGNNSINQQVTAQLQHSAARDMAELLPHLERRASERAEVAIQMLAKRGQDESKQMREILESQKKHIAATSQQSGQGKLPFREDELRQLEANRRHWNKRLDELESELETEPARIREVYDVRARRIEAVGLVYLWPVTN